MHESNLYNIHALNVQRSSLFRISIIRVVLFSLVDKLLKTKLFVNVTCDYFIISFLSANTSSSSLFYFIITNYRYSFNYMLCILLLQITIIHLITCHVFYYKLPLFF